MNVKFKKALALTSALVIGTATITANAATLTKTLKAEYHNIKVTYDGKLQTPTLEPFMVNGSVYVGLRDSGQMTNNDVSWDGANKTVHITSKEQTPSVDSEELAKKNLQIASLTSQVESLNKEIAGYKSDIEKYKADIEKYKKLLDEKDKEEENKEVTKDKLKNLIEDLEDDYGKDYKVSWEFDLGYNEKNKTIDFTVDYESKYDANDFNNISASSLKKFLTKMCEDIQDTFESINIEGTVVDSTKDETVVEFSMNAKQNFEMMRQYSKGAIRDFENSLYKNHGTLPTIPSNELKDLTIKAKSFYINPSRDYDEVIFEIRTDLAKEKAEAWNKLEEGYNTRDLVYYLDTIAEDIENFFNASEIDGYIRNNDDQIIIKYEDGRLRLEDF